MRLLHVTHQYKPAIGGAEQYITSLSEEMAQRNHQVTVYTSRSRDYLTWHNELPAFEQLAGVEVHRFRSLVRGPRTWKILEYGNRHYWQTHATRYEPLIFLGNGPVCFGLFWSILWQGSKFDLVHISNLHYAHAALAYAAARWRALPVVLTPHIHVEQPVTYGVGYLQRILKGSQHVITVTQAERQYLLSQGFDHQRVTAAGNGIDLAKFPARDQNTCKQELGLPEDAFVLLFLGRKSDYKGLDLVLKAFATLQDRYSTLHLLAVGPETESSRELWARCGGLPRLINHGSVSDEMRLTALNACDCLVLPSTGEAFGIVYLEAWAVGKPVIGARIHAVSSVIIDGQDGYLISPGSVAELAERITRWLDDPLLAHEMGRRGQEKVKNRYTVPRIADIVEGVYRRVLRRVHQTQNGEKR